MRRKCCLREREVESQRLGFSVVPALVCRVPLWLGGGWDELLSSRDPEASTVRVLGTLPGPPSVDGAGWRDTVKPAEGRTVCGTGWLPVYRLRTIAALAELPFGKR